MAWADSYIEKLLLGQTVEFRPRGSSMSGRVESGQLCTVIPVTNFLKKNDIVLCQVGGSQYLHLIKSVKNDRYQIGNNHGKINGWIGPDNIYGVLISAV